MRDARLAHEATGASGRRTGAASLRRQPRCHVPAEPRHNDRAEPMPWEPSPPSSSPPVRPASSLQSGAWGLRPAAVGYRCAPGARARAELARPPPARHAPRPVGPREEILQAVRRFAAAEAAPFVPGQTYIPASGKQIGAHPTTPLGPHHRRVRPRGRCAFRPRAPNRGDPVESLRCQPPPLLHRCPSPNGCCCAMWRGPPTRRC